LAQPRNGFRISTYDQQTTTFDSETSVTQADGSGSTTYSGNRVISGLGWRHIYQHVRDGSLVEETDYRSDVSTPDDRPSYHETIEHPNGDEQPGSIAIPPGSYAYVEPLTAPTPTQMGPAEQPPAVPTGEVADARNNVLMSGAMAADRAAATDAVFAEEGFSGDHYPTTNRAHAEQDPGNANRSDGTVYSDDFDVGRFTSTSNYGVLGVHYAIGPDGFPYPIVSHYHPDLASSPIYTPRPQYKGPSISQWVPPETWQNRAIRNGHSVWEVMMVDMLRPGGGTWQAIDIVGGAVPGSPVPRAAGAHSGTLPYVPRPPQYTSRPEGYPRPSITRAPRGAFDPFLGAGGEAGFGKLVNWGVGARGATARTASITKAELQQMGMTRDVAQHWLNFYKNAVDKGRGAATAPERIKLMERILELLN